MLKEYQQGVFIRLIIPIDQISGERAVKENRMAPCRKRLNEIVSTLESQAFYDGYPLAMGFEAGPCKRAFCPDEDFSALIRGKGCRHPLRGRPSMESAGMNVYAMAARAG